MYPIRSLVAKFFGPDSISREYALRVDLDQDEYQVRIILTTDDHVVGLYDYAPGPHAPKPVTDMLGVLANHRGHCLGHYDGFSPEDVTLLP